MTDGVFQPFVTLSIRNTRQEQFAEAEKCLSDTVREILAGGLDKEALLAELERWPSPAGRLRSPTA